MSQLAKPLDRPAATPPRKLAFRFPSRRAMLSASRADGAGMSLFVPTPEDFSVGSAVELEISFGDCDAKFQIACVVGYRRSTRAGFGQDVGVGLSFVGENKKEAAKMFAFAAGRSAGQGRGTNLRVETELKCLVRVGGRKLKGRVLDLSNGGAFITTAKGTNLRVGAKLELRLSPGLFGFGGNLVEARVVWSGNKGGAPGYGTRFLGDPGVLRPVIKKYLSPAK